MTRRQLISTASASWLVIRRIVADDDTNSDAAVERHEFRPIRGYG
jgi:hypothetical protein